MLQRTAAALLLLGLPALTRQGMARSYQHVRPIKADVPDAVLT